MVTIPSTSFYYLKCGAPFQIGFENLISGLNLRYGLLKHIDNVLISGTEAETVIPESSWFDYSEEIDYRNPPSSIQPWNDRFTYGIFDHSLQAGNIPKAAVSPDFNRGWSATVNDDTVWRYVDDGFTNGSRYYADRPLLYAYLYRPSLDLPDDDTCYPSGITYDHPYRQISRRLHQAHNAPSSLWHSTGASGTIWPLDLDGYDMFAGMLRSMSSMNIGRDFIYTYDNKGLSAVYDLYTYTATFDRNTGTFGTLSKTHSETVNSDSYHRALRAYVTGGYSGATTIIINVQKFKEYRTTNAFPEEMMPYVGYGLCQSPSLTAWYEEATQEQKGIFDEITEDNITYDFTPRQLIENKLTMTKEEGSSFYKWNAVNIGDKIEIDEDGFADDVMHKDVVVTSSENQWGEIYWNYSLKVADFSDIRFSYQENDIYMTTLLHLDFRDYLRR